MSPAEIAARYDKILGRVLNHEGGYTRNPADRGNWTSGKIGVGRLLGTKYGISAMSYPDVDIPNLTWAGACHLYIRDFLAPIHAERLHFGIASLLADFAINSGVRTALRTYQRVLGVAQDGIIGPKTLAAAEAVAVHDQAFLLIGYRMDLMIEAPRADTFWRGWMRRIADNLVFAARDI